MQSSSNQILHHWIEKVERVVKHSYLHNVQQQLSSQWIYLPNNADENRKIFWIHIPRTSGNSIRTDLIGKNAEWLIDYAWWQRENVPFDIRHPKHGSQHKVYKKWSNRSVQVIKGWFSWRIVQNYNGIGHEHKKIFTIMRYPTERIYSLYKRLTTYGDHNKVKCRLLHALFGQITIGNTAIENDRCVSLREFLNISNCRLQSLITNYVTMQLSDQVVLKGCRDINEDLHRMRFERAKQNLVTLDFIGFYENMYHDFDALRDEIFPDIQGSFFLRNIFNLGTLIALPRMRVLKYSNIMNKEDLEYIEKKNKYDIMLYNYAKRITNKTFMLHRSYTEYLFQN